MYIASSTTISGDAAGPRRAFAPPIAYSEPTWLSFSCRFEDRSLERGAVPAELWSNPKFAGLAFVFFKWEIGRRLEILS